MAPRITTWASALLAGTTALAAPAMTPFKRDLSNTAFQFGQDKVRGVNLGGWFVLEPWITPSIFQPYAQNQAAVDEWTLCSTLGQDAASSLLQAHWSSWITEDDFSQIASLGLNFVRIPIGYWSVLPTPIPGDPYVQGAYDYLKQSLDWAASNNIAVLIDLHGAPGSQNGFDNSGHYGPIDWFSSQSNIDYTHTALNQIRNDTASHPAVAAIELVNEPMGPQLDYNTLVQFMNDGWGDLRYSDVGVTFHDAFLGVDSWNNFGAGESNLILDTHHYEVFDVPSLQMSTQQHISTACAFGQNMTQSNKWTISGEWTGAMTDCATWLNGLGKGSRYDGSYENSNAIGSCDGLSSGTVDGLSSDMKNNIGMFVEAQMDAFEEAEGWIFWTWKTESAPEWHLQNLTAAGVFPNPVTNRNHPGQCG